MGPADSDLQSFAFQAYFHLRYLAAHDTSTALESVSMAAQRSFWDGFSGPRWEQGSRVGPQNWQDGRADLHDYIIRTETSRYVHVMAPPGTGKSTTIMLDAVQATREKHPDAQVFYFVESEREQEWLSTVLEGELQAKSLLGEQLTESDLQGHGDEANHGRGWYFGTYSDALDILGQGLLPKKAIVILDVDLYMGIEFMLFWAHLRLDTTQVMGANDS